MTRYRLNRDVTVKFRGDYDVSAPKGTPVIRHKDGGGCDIYAIPPTFCDAGGMGKPGTWSIFGHDSTYYHVWAPTDAVEAFQ